MRHTHHQRRRHQGQILPIFVIVFAVVSGVLGLMLDGGHVYLQKRLAQNAADAAAVAGAQELRRGNDLSTTLVRNRIKQDAQLYGFEATDITVAYPPSNGPHAGDDKFVSVRVSDDVPMSFMRFFNRSITAVSARATAGLQVGGDACVIALDRTSRTDAFKANGTVNINANCGIMVNSTEPGNAMRNLGGA